MLDKQCIGDLNNKNTPVVYVTWDEAIKFCDWLTVRWTGAGYLKQGWRVDLPSEAEWEKAAKGGLHIPKPKAAKIVTVSKTLIEQLHNDVELENNQLSKRLYPWGDEIDHEKLNYEMKIGTVSALGCYPLGQSPYGCEEMAGNVWEWTRSAYQENYPVNPSEWRKRNDRAQKNVGRVLRGGAFDLTGYSVRCAARNLNTPADLYNFVGFRVVLCPHTSER